MKYQIARNGASTEAKRDGVYINVSVDVQAATEFLSSMGVKHGEKDKILRSVLAGIGSSAKTQVRKNYHNYFPLNPTMTGRLYDSIQRRVTKKGDAVIIDASARKNGRYKYGYALANGATILPRKFDFLFIRNFEDGVLAFSKMKQVILPKKPFVKEPLDRWIGSSAYNKRIDSIINQKIAQLEREKAKGK